MNDRTNNLQISQADFLLAANHAQIRIVGSENKQFIMFLGGKWWRNRDTRPQE